MKFLSTLLVAVLATLVVYAARRRILFALKTGAVVYLIMLPLRLLSVAGTVFERFDELVRPLLLLLVVWLALWWLSTAYERRKLAQRRLAPRQAPTVRRRRIPW